MDLKTIGAYAKTLPNSKYRNLTDEDAAYAYVKDNPTSAFVRNLKVTEPSAPMRFASDLASQFDIRPLKEALTSPLEVARGAASSVGQHGREFFGGAGGLERMQHGVGMIPMLGESLYGTIEKYKTGDIAGALGETLGYMSPLALVGKLRRLSQLKKGAAKLPTEPQLRLQEQYPDQQPTSMEPLETTSGAQLQRIPPPVAQPPYEMPGRTEPQLLLPPKKLNIGALKAQEVGRQNKLRQAMPETKAKIAEQPLTAKFRIDSLPDAQKDLLKKVKMKPVESSNLKAIGRKGDITVVEFHKGGGYAYIDVDQKIWRGLNRAKSKGKYFREHMRNVEEIPYSRLSEEDLGLIPRQVEKGAVNIDTMLGLDTLMKPLKAIHAGGSWGWDYGQRMFMRAERYLADKGHADVVKIVEDAQADAAHATYTGAMTVDQTFEKIIKPAVQDARRQFKERSLPENVEHQANFYLDTIEGHGEKIPEVDSHWSKKINRMFYLATLGGDPTLFPQNLSQLLNTMIEHGIFPTLKGLTKVGKESRMKLAESGALRSAPGLDVGLHEAPTGKVGKTWEYTKDVLNLPLSGSEYINRLGSYFAALDEAGKKGLTDIDARRYAYNKVKKTQFYYGSESPIRFIEAMRKIPGGSVLMNYQTRQTGFLAETLKDVAQNRDYGKLARLVGLKGAEYAIGSRYMQHPEYLAPAIPASNPILQRVGSIGPEVARTLQSEAPLSEKTERIARKVGESTVPAGRVVSKYVVPKKEETRHKKLQRLKRLGGDTE